MQPAEVQRAVAAAISTARRYGLQVDGAVVLQNSNKLALRLLPDDVVARIAPWTQQVAEFEVELARRLAETGSPVASLDPRVPPRVHEDDGFAITFWTYHASMTREIASADYASALSRLHAAMRPIPIGAPHFTDRVAEAEQLVADRNLTPELDDVDRELLGGLLQSLRRTIVAHGAAEQLLHGEPHPGNVLGATAGPLFIDLETCCVGPVEFDLAHVPDAVVAHYPHVDQALLGQCRALVLAMVAAWRWDVRDQFPNGRAWARQFIRILRKGAPWPSLYAATRQLGDG